jgi:pimeloyl-ACP methyl ester carboxylesterase
MNSTITTKDGVKIFYKDWGSGQPIVFHHGWPLSSDDWDAQMLFFLSKGYRVVAHDRRGHGRSSQVGTGHDMDHYASDASAVVEHLDLRNAIHIGHSTGGGEVARYVAKYGKPQVEAPTPLVWTPHHAVPNVTRRLPVFAMPAHVATSVRCGSLDRDSMYSTPMLPKAVSSPAGLEQTKGRRWSPA